MEDVITMLFQDPHFLSVDKSTRIAYATRFFLGKPYLVNPLGEGENARIDSAPLYRFDGFDCVTYVNTVLALAFSNHEKSFLLQLLRINYYDAIPRFENRFHFMSVDWNPQNQKNQYVCDVTKTICDENNHSIALLAEGEINRIGWLLKKAEGETPERAAHLHEIAKNTQNVIGSLPYLPLSILFDAQQNPREYLFAQIPHASVIEIVRPNWNIKEKIGTNLHVSHVGFAIRLESGELVFRHASSEQKYVVEVSLSDYLKQCLESATIKGINVQKII